MWTSAAGKVSAVNMEYYKDQTDHQQEKNLRPVIDILTDELYSAAHPTNGLLVHAISNGGWGNRVFENKN